MSNLKKNYLVVCMVFAMIAVTTFLSGCTETQKPKVWGKGELSPEWVEMFGDDNLSRLNKAQSDYINKHEKQIAKHESHLYGVDQVKDGKKVHNYGLIDLVVDLQNRVKALEAVDPNECPLQDNVEELNGVVGMLLEGPTVVE